MKKIVMAMVLLASASSFATEYITFERCSDENPNVRNCVIGKSVVRRPNTAAEAYVFPPTDDRVTVKTDPGVPVWIQELNYKLEKAGFKAVPLDETVRGGAF